MKARTATKLTERAFEVLELTLEGIIKIINPLIVALYLSDVEEYKRIYEMYPSGHDIYKVLDAVRIFHTDIKQRDEYVKNGFFNEQIEHLLNLAKTNRDAGARLSPVFYIALHISEELKIPNELQDRIVAQLERQRRKDGFVIMGASERITLYFAPDVIPE